MMRIPALPQLHVFFEIAAFFCAFQYFQRLRRREPDPIPEARRLWILVGAAGGAWLGSRLLGFLEHPDGLGVWDGSAVLAALRRRTIVGGLLGGVLGVEFAKRLLGETRRSGDLFVFPLLLGLLIGRVGCLLSSLAERTAGVPTGLPWGVDFGDGAARHPLMLYELLFLGILWPALAAARRRLVLDGGALFRLFLTSYLLFRFAVEALKPDWRYPWGLTAIQTACLIGLLAYRRVWRDLRPEVAHA
jgi:phosphatidylglycerol---prolipoprotein diacylglyceryl transferase